MVERAIRDEVEIKSRGASTEPGRDLPDAEHLIGGDRADPQ